MPSDAELLDAFYAGNIRALDRLADRYDHRLGGFLMHLVSRPELADALLDDLWGKIYLSRTGNARKRPDRGSVEGFLLSLAAHLAWRANSKHRLPDAQNDDRQSQAVDRLAERYDCRLVGFLSYLVQEPETADLLCDNLWGTVYLSRNANVLQSLSWAEGYLLSLAGHLAWEWMTA